jgi:hypothetical protein
VGRRSDRDLERLFRFYDGQSLCHGPAMSQTRNGLIGAR